MLPHDDKGLSLTGVLSSINAMTAKVRRTQSLFMTSSDQGAGWWVLAVGEDMEGLPFEERDLAREALRVTVEATGILLPEYVWVWDDARQAQLVIATFPTLDRARRVAERLREKGLKIRVARETA